MPKSYLIIVFPTPQDDKSLHAFFENQSYTFIPIWEGWATAPTMQQDWMKSAGNIRNSDNHYLHFMIVSNLEETGKRTANAQGYNTKCFQDIYSTVVAELDILKHDAEKLILSKDTLATHIIALYYSNDHSIDPRTIDEFSFPGSLFTRVMLKNEVKVNQLESPKIPLLTSQSMPSTYNASLLEEPSHDPYKQEQLIRERIIKTFTPCLRRVGFLGLFQGIKPYDRPARIILNVLNSTLTSAGLKAGLEKVLKDIRQQQYGRNPFLVNLQAFIQDLDDLQNKKPLCWSVT